MKVLFVKKRTLKILFVFLLLCSFCTLNFNGLPVASIYFNNRIKKVPIYNVSTTDNKVAISFDAAWGADKTSEIMSICKEYNVNATFFLVGFWVEDYPEMAKMIADNGFEIGLHSNTHPDMTKLSANQMKLELENNIDIIRTTTNVTPTLFRPPFGAYNDNLINLCDEMKIYPIQWDVDSLDWKGISASQIASRVIDKAKPGSIVLFHNNADNIIPALKLVLEHFKTNNLQACSVGDLIHKSDYKINQQGTQIKN